MTKECTDATDTFYHTWVPSTTHVITFGQLLTKLQKKCQTINVIISDAAKTLHFVGQIYKSDCFTEEQMTTNEMKSDADKVWYPTLDHFSLLITQQKHMVTIVLQTVDLTVPLPCTMFPLIAPSQQLQAVASSYLRPLY